jgi:hypothetical protein
VVMTRDPFAPELALSVASSRRVPMLVIASRTCKLPNPGLKAPACVVSHDKE